MRPSARLRWFAPRLFASAVVVLMPLAVLVYVGSGWLMPATPDHPASDLGELPVELWPVIVLMPLICWVVGLRAVWRGVHSVADGATALLIVTSSTAVSSTSRSVGADELDGPPTV